MFTPDQFAVLDRVAVQAKALRDKTQMLELQQAEQPEQFNRTIEALTRPNPVQRTTAPYEVPSRIDDRGTHCTQCAGKTHDL